MHHTTGRDDEQHDPGDPEAVLGVFRSIVEKTRLLLAANVDWSMSGDRPAQYAIDVGMDEMCVGGLRAAGFAVLSEESGLTAANGHALESAPDAIVVVDPLDGSTNASLGLPWCATTLCLVVDRVPMVALVANLRTGDVFDAVRGRGARRNGQPIDVVQDAPRLADAIVAVNAEPPVGFARRQLRALGATALDMSSVAASGTTGGFHGYIDFDDDAIGVWDYLAAALIVEEAGGVTADALGRDLVTLDHRARRRPVAAVSQALLDELLAADDSAGS